MSAAHFFLVTRLTYFRDASYVGCMGPPVPADYCGASGWLSGPAWCAGCRGVELGHEAAGCVALGSLDLVLAHLWVELSSGLGGCT